MAKNKRITNYLSQKNIVCIKCVKYACVILKLRRQEKKIHMCYSSHLAARRKYLLHKCETFTTQGTGLVHSVPFVKFNFGETSTGISFHVGWGVTSKPGFACFLSWSIGIDHMVWLLRVRPPPLCTVLSELKVFPLINHSVTLLQACTKHCVLEREKY